MLSIGCQERSFSDMICEDKGFVLMQCGNGWKRSLLIFALSGVVIGSQSTDTAERARSGSRLRYAPELQLLRSLRRFRVRPIRLLLSLAGAFLALLVGSAAVSGDDSQDDLFLTRAELKEVKVSGVKHLRWVPTKDKINFAWSDQPFAVHIPFDLRSKVDRSGRPAAGGNTSVLGVPEGGGGDTPERKTIVNRIKISVRGFGAGQSFGFFQVPIVSAGLYRVDGQPPDQEDPSPVHVIDVSSWRRLTDLPNLDIPNRQNDKPTTVAAFQCQPTAQTRYVYWLVLEPRSRRATEEERRVLDRGLEFYGVNAPFWSQFAECKGSFVASLEEDGSPSKIEKKLDVAVLQNCWQIQEAKVQLKGDWQQEVAQGWKVEDVATEWKNSTLTSTHRLKSIEGQSDVAVTLRLPPTIYDHQAARVEVELRQLAPGKFPRTSPYGLNQDLGHALALVFKCYAYSDQPGSPDRTVKAGRNFSTHGGKDWFTYFGPQNLVFDWEQNRDPQTGLYRHVYSSVLDGARAGESPYLTAADNKQMTLPGNLMADQSLPTAHRLFGLDIQFDSAAKDRHTTAPVKHVDLLAMRYSDVRNNRVGNTQDRETQVVEEPDDGYWEWKSHEFSELEKKNEQRLLEILKDLGEYYQKRQKAFEKWLLLLKLDQMTFPPEGDVLDELRRFVHHPLGGEDRPFRLTDTQAHLMQMKQERDELRAEMAAIRPEQEKLVQEGLRLSKQVLESVEGQIIRSRESSPPPKLIELRDEYKDRLAMDKLRMYEAAGWFGADELQKVVEECRFAGPEAREWTELLKAKAAQARYEVLEQHLVVLRAMPNPPKPGSPQEQLAMSARVEEVAALRAVLHLNPRNVETLQRLSQLETAYVSAIAAKVDQEKQLTFGLFKAYLENRGYPVDPEQQMAWPLEFVSVLFEHAITSVTEGANTRPVSANLTTVERAEEETSRKYEALAKNIVSLALIKRLIRGGLLLSEIRQLPEDEFENFIWTKTVGGHRLDRAKINFMWLDMKQTFDELGDLRALADGNADEFVAFMNRNYYDMLDPSKTRWERAGDFVFNVILFRMGGRVGSKLANTWPAKALANKFTSTGIGRWAASQFTADLEAYESYTQAQKLTRTAAGAAAQLAVYGYASHVLHDMPSLRVFVDLFVMTGASELTYEALASRGVELKMIEPALVKAEAACVGAKKGLNAARQRIEKLKKIAKDIKRKGPAVNQAPQPEQQQQLNELMNAVEENPVAAIDPNLRAGEGLVEAITAAKTTVKTRIDHAQRALAAAGVWLDELETMVREFETKLQQARELLAEGKPPQLSQLKNGLPVPINTTTPARFWIPKDFPPGPFADFLKFGDLALMRGETGKALELYRAALKTKRKLGLPDPERVVEEVIEKRVALAEQTLKAAEEFAGMKRRNLPFSMLDEIRPDQVETMIRDLAVAGENPPLRLVKLSSQSKNQVYYVVGNDGKKWLFKRLSEESANTEAIAAVVLETVGERVPACRKISSATEVPFYEEVLDRQGKPVMENGQVKLKETGEKVPMTGTLFQYVPGTELMEMTEAQAVALKKDLARQRVFRLLLGDFDGHLRNIRVGRDGKPYMIDFDWGHFTDSKLHSVLDYFNQYTKTTNGVLEVQTMEGTEKIVFPQATDEAGFLEAVLLLPRILVDSQRGDPHLYGWIDRLDGMLTYDDMAGAVQEIQQAIKGDNLLRKLGLKQGAIVRQSDPVFVESGGNNALRDMGVPKELREQTFKEITARAQLLEKVLMKRFKAFKQLPKNPVGTVWPLKHGRFHSVRSLAA